MARYQGSAVAEQTKGRIGETVFVGGQGNGYIRSFAKPINPKSKYQLEVRADFAAISKEWSALTQAQRNAWDNAAKKQVRSDKTKSFGGSHTLSGKAFYQEINSNRKLCGQASTNTPPTRGEFGDYTGATLTLTNTGNGATFTTTNNPGKANYIVLEYVAPVSQGTKNVSGRYRVVEAFSLNSSKSKDVKTKFNARFGTPAAGSKVFARIRVLDTNFFHVAYEPVAVTIS